MFKCLPCAPAGPQNLATTLSLLTCVFCHRCTAVCHQHQETKIPNLSCHPDILCAICCLLLSVGMGGSGGGVTGCHGGCVGEVTPTAEEGFALWSFLPTSPITACPLTRPPLKHFGRVKGPDFLASLCCRDVNRSHLTYSLTSLTQ